jgi:putative ABC transport system ATP-binding protein
VFGSEEIRRWVLGSEEKRSLPSVVITGTMAAVVDGSGESNEGQAAGGAASVGTKQECADVGIVSPGNSGPVVDETESTKVGTFVSVTPGNVHVDATSVSSSSVALFQSVSKKVLGESVISVTNLSKEYMLPGRREAVVALRSVGINDDEEVYSIRKGEFVMIRGASGGGKTTLLNCIGLIDAPSAGHVTLLGTRVDFSTATDEWMAQIRLEKVGFVFQTFNLLGTFSAMENVMLPIQILGKLNAKQAKARAEKLLTLVGLEDRMDHIPSELSGGEQQRVTIARALSNDPEILLLDEPTGDLDTLNTLEIMQLLLTVNQHGKKTMVMVTHNDDLECYADRIIYVADGQIVRQALNTVQSVLDYEKYVQFLKRKMYGEIGKDGVGEI